MERLLTFIPSKEVFFELSIFNSSTLQKRMRELAFSKQNADVLF